MKPDLHVTTRGRGRRIAEQRREKLYQFMDSRQILKRVADRGTKKYVEPDRLGSMDESQSTEVTRQSSPINRAYCRQLILKRFRHLRGDYLADKLTRVSPSSLDWLEARVQNMIDDAVRRHPTVGATVYLDRVR